MMNVDSVKARLKNFAIKVVVLFRKLLLTMVWKEQSTEFRYQNMQIISF